MLASADGCRGGWVVALADCWPCHPSPRFEVHETFQALLYATAHCRVLVVDMPIGLPTGAEHRPCDEIGKAKLGAVGTTRLFYAPPRPTLTARTPSEFQLRHRAVTGRGAGLPVWGIAPKLREVDAIMTPDLQQRVFEFHPELTWQRLAGTTLPSKHTHDGLNRRMALLRDSVPDLDTITLPRTGLRRRDVELDDLLDALVGLAVAQAIADGPDIARRIPRDEPERDERGLRMEIWS